MRRHECEIEDPGEIKRILNTACVGRMATIDLEGYPYITPVNFVFYEGCIYFHCAPRGEKWDNLMRSPRVCFEVDIPQAYLGVDFNPERNSCRAHQLYFSVIIRGEAQVVPEGDFKTEILNCLLTKHEGSSDFPPVTPESPGYRACRVVSIKPVRMTGKAELGQSSPQKHYRDFIAQQLVRRGLAQDLETVKAMEGTRLTEPKETGTGPCGEGIWPR